MEQLQKQLNKDIAVWREQYGRPIGGKEAVEKFSPYAFAFDNWIVLTEALDPYFSSSRAQEMRMFLTLHRIDELERGAKLSDEEASMWQLIYAQKSSEADSLVVNHLTSTNGTEVWLLAKLKGLALNAPIIDAAGPFWSEKAVLERCTGIMANWFGWTAPPWQPEKQSSILEHLSLLFSRVL